MEINRIRIINKSKHGNPEYANQFDAGCDIKCNFDHKHILKPGNTLLVPTGLYVELPFGYEIQVRPRSGLALKHGVTVLNSPGTIDCGYKGEIGVILINHGKKDFEINPGDRIAQFVLNEVNKIEWVNIDEFKSISDRNGGFGSTGV